ncbi:MAG: hypothetical protein J5582_11495 [Ruminococcus sp.]|uniref:hypothetical protein n=1 Tax=Ruminococcus sp. TaxID=41978 RepID=UPI0025DB2248|nr:hypothetical protein [Ruminococcus sp.]MBO4867159.1 hypothetical protein [Ruminococcus sp.]
MNILKHIAAILAKKQKTIFYSDLSELDEKPAHSVGKVIGELSKHCHSLGLPPISGSVKVLI